MAKRKARRTPTPRKRTAELAEYARHTGATLDSLMKSVDIMSDGLKGVNGALKVNVAGTREVSIFLVSQIAALRDLLIRKGVITAEEALAVAQISELDRMLNAQSKPPRRRRPPPDPQGGA